MGGGVMEMVWTVSKPTAPGWYWFEDRDEFGIYQIGPLPKGDDGHIYILNRYQRGDAWLVSGTRGAWAGPIDRPLQKLVICKECGKEFLAKRISRELCSNACKTANYRSRKLEKSISD